MKKLSRNVQLSLPAPSLGKWDQWWVRYGFVLIAVIGAFAIGSIFTELLGQNISSSSWIFFAWLVLGVAAFIAYRHFHQQPIWEPLEMPRERRHLPREGPQITQTLVGPPTAQRVHLGRRGRYHEAAPEPEQFPAVRSWMEDVREIGPRRTAATLGIFLLVSVAAIWFDLSRYDPFGPRLGWSVGVVTVAFVSTFLLLRSHRGL